MTQQTFSTTFAIITPREKTDLSTFSIFKDKLYDSLRTVTHFHQQDNN